MTAAADLYLDTDADNEATMTARMDAAEARFRSAADRWLDREDFLSTLAPDVSVPPTSHHPEDH